MKSVEPPYMITPDSQLSCMDEKCSLVISLAPHISLGGKFYEQDFGSAFGFGLDISREQDAIQDEPHHVMLGV